MYSIFLILIFTSLVVVVGMSTTGAVEKAARQTGKKTQNSLTRVSSATRGTETQTAARAASPGSVTHSEDSATPFRFYVHSTNTIG